MHEVPSYRVVRRIRHRSVPSGCAAMPLTCLYYARSDESTHRQAPQRSPKEARGTLPMFTLFSGLSSAIAAYSLIDRFNLFDIRRQIDLVMETREAALAIETPERANIGFWIFWLFR